MEKKKVFVSVPMSGKDDAVIKRAIQVTKRAYCKAKGLKAKDVDFYDNQTELEKMIAKCGCGIEDDPEVLHKNVAYLALAYCTMSSCDEVVFGQGWQNARGCMLERMACVLYGIPAVEV